MDHCPGITVPVWNHTKGGDAEGGPRFDSLKREDGPETLVDNIEDLVVKEFDMVLGGLVGSPLDEGGRGELYAGGQEHHGGKGTPAGARAAGWGV